MLSYNVVSVCRLSVNVKYVLWLNIVIKMQKKMQIEIITAIPYVERAPYIATAKSLAVRSYVRDVEVS